MGGDTRKGVGYQEWGDGGGGGDFRKWGGGTGVGGEWGVGGVGGRISGSGHHIGMVYPL